jgi:hypothetical protein
MNTFKKIQLIDMQSGEETDITEYMRPISYTITRPAYAMPDVPTDPRTHAYMKAITKLMSLRMSASMFGVRSEVWVQSQLTDEDRAALAHEADRAARLALPEATHD